MSKKFAGLIFLLSLLLPSMVWSQGNPRPYGAYTFDTGAWSPATSTYTDQALWYDPTPVALYCLNTTTNQWVPATSACFGGGGGGAVSSVANSDGTLTISPTTGAVVASLNLAHANTWSAIQTFSTAPTFSGLTGYVYANGASQVGAATTIPLGSVVSTAGTLAPLYLANATSGLLALEPLAGALGTITEYLPIAGGDTLIAESATDTTTTHVLHATVVQGVGIYSAIAAGDLPTTLTSGTIVPAAGITPQSIDCHTACSPTAAQLSNAQVWNYGQAASNVQVTGPTVAAGMNFLMVVGTAQGANYWRYTSTTANIYLDGGASAVTNIIFAAPAVGNSFSCFSFQIGASTYALKCTTLAGTSTSS